MPLRMVANSPVMDRLISASIAMILGFLVWLYARSRDQEMLDNVPVPVQISLVAPQAEQYDLQITGSSQVTASFAGPPTRMRELRNLLQRGGLGVQVTFAVPPDRQGEGRYLDTVRIDAGDIHPPPGVRATVVEGRNRIPVTLRRLVERRLPVHLDTALEERISKIAVEPTMVLVRGPQDILERTRAVPTQPYVLPRRPELTAVQNPVTATSVPLVQELEGRPIKTMPRAVAVRLTLQARQKMYEVVDVPVQFLCPANFPFRPEWRNERDGRISLRLIGPTGEERPVVSAYIDLTRRKFEAGFYAEEPVRLQLPKDFQLGQGPTPTATFQLKPLAAN